MVKAQSRERGFRLSGKRTGFTLIELLAVMAIMATLATLAITSYFGAVRGMSRRSAISQVANTLLLARQRACMENSRVSVVFFNESTGSGSTDFTPSYVVCKEMGQVTYMTATHLVDEFNELDKTFGLKEIDVSEATYRGSIRLYNLTQGKWSEVYPWAEHYPLSYTSASGIPTTGESFINAFGLKKNQVAEARNSNSAMWSVGDSYGIEVTAVATLPRHFIFGNMRSSGNTYTITFEPSGKADLTRGVSRLEIRETVAPEMRNSISINQGGSVTYSERWSR